MSFFLLISSSPSTYNIEKRATYSFATTSFRRKWLDSHDSKATSRPAADTRMRTDLIDDDIARDLMTSIEGIVSEKLVSILLSDITYCLTKETHGEILLINIIFFFVLTSAKLKTLLGHFP